MGAEHTAAVIASNQIGFNVMQGLAVWVSVVRIRHGKAMVAAHDPEKAMKWRMQDATGAWQEELATLASHTQNCGKLEEAGFLPAAEAMSATDSEKAVDIDLARVLHRFLVHLLAKRILYGSIASLGFPWAAASLLSTDHRLEGALENMKQFWNQ